MTYEEFGNFWNEVYSAYPSLYEWVMKMHSDGNGVITMKSMHRNWYKALQNCTVEECRAVLESWLTGERKSFHGYYDRDNVAILIRNYVESDRREKWNQQQAEMNRASSGSMPKAKFDTPLAPILAKVMRLRKNGVVVTDAEIERKVLEELEAMVSDEDRPVRSYARCLDCSDKGVVEVWRMNVAHDVDVGKIEASEARGTYNVACHCDAGQHHREGHDRWKPMPVYRPNDFCIYKNRPLGVEQQALVEWLNSRTVSLNFYDG